MPQVSVSVRIRQGVRFRTPLVLVLECSWFSYLFAAYGFRCAELSAELSDRGIISLFTPNAAVVRNYFFGSSLNASVARKYVLLVHKCSGRFRGPYRECEKDNVAVFVVFKVSRRTRNPSKSRPLLFGGETLAHCVGQGALLEHEHVRLQFAVSGSALAGVHRCLSPCVLLAHWHAMSNVSLSPVSL